MHKKKWKRKDCERIWDAWRDSNKYDVSKGATGNEVMWVPGKLKRRAVTEKFHQQQLERSTDAIKNPSEADVEALQSHLLAQPGTQDADWLRGQRSSGAVALPWAPRPTDEIEKDSDDGKGSDVDAGGTEVEEEQDQTSLVDERLATFGSLVAKYETTKKLLTSITVLAAEQQRDNQSNSEPVTESEQAVRLAIQGSFSARMGLVHALCKQLDVKEENSIVPDVHPAALPVEPPKEQDDCFEVASDDPYGLVDLAFVEAKVEPEDTTDDCRGNLDVEENSANGAPSVSPPLTDEALKRLAESLDEELLKAFNDLPISERPFTSSNGLCSMVSIHRKIVQLAHVSSLAQLHNEKDQITTGLVVANKLKDSLKRIALKLSAHKKEIATRRETEQAEKSRKAATAEAEKQKQALKDKVRRVTGESGKTLPALLNFGPDKFSAARDVEEVGQADANTVCLVHTHTSIENWLQEREVVKFLSDFSTSYKKSQVFQDTGVFDERLPPESLRLLSSTKAAFSSVHSAVGVDVSSVTKTIHNGFWVGGRQPKGFSIMLTPNLAGMVRVQVFGEVQVACAPSRLVYQMLEDSDPGYAEKISQVGVEMYFSKLGADVVDKLAPLFSCAVCRVGSLLNVPQNSLLLEKVLTGQVVVHVRRSMYLKDPDMAVSFATSMNTYSSENAKAKLKSILSLCTDQ